MRLCIPHIGTSLVLQDDWTFRLFYERRNMAFLKSLPVVTFDQHGRIDLSKFLRSPEFEAEPHHFSWSGGDLYYLDYTLPEGTHLKVDRIYVRKGKGYDRFDSVTVCVNTHLTPAKARKQGLTRGRFWAKLADVNRAEVIAFGSTIPGYEAEALL